MSVSIIRSRFTKTVLTQYRVTPLLFCHHGRSRNLHCFYEQVVSGHISFPHQSALHSSTFQRFGFSSSPSPQSNEEAQSGNGKENKGDNDANTSKQTEASISNDLKNDLSKDDLLKLVAEKEKLLELKQEELEELKTKILRAYADTEKVKKPTMLESENRKKLALQNIAKSLSDVAENLGRASSAAKESFSKIDASKDTAGVVQQLKVLLEGVEMTEKELSELGNKFYELISIALLYGDGGSNISNKTWFAMLATFSSAVTVGSLFERILDWYIDEKNITPVHADAIMGALEDVQKTADEIKKAVDEIPHQHGVFRSVINFYHYLASYFSS